MTEEEQKNHCDECERFGLDYYENENGEQIWRCPYCKYNYNENIGDK